MRKNFPQITSNLFDIMVILHKKVFNPLVISKAINLTPAQFSVLFYLMRKDNSSVTDAAKYLKISKPNMTPILDSLINIGYISRQRDLKDRRVIRLNLTDSGRDFYDDMKKANLHIVEEIFSEYTDEELKHLLVSSTELTNSLRQIAEFLEDPLVSHEED
ncbi:MAG: MarR family transcriptional regulator [Clostridiaceae bacterium]